MRMSDWSSDVCSSDLFGIGVRAGDGADDVEGVVDVGDPVAQRLVHRVLERPGACLDRDDFSAEQFHAEHIGLLPRDVDRAHEDGAGQAEQRRDGRCGDRSEEHTSELQSLMRISYAVFCLKKKQDTMNHNFYTPITTATT